MLRFEDQTIELGKYVVNGRLPDMELTDCEVRWGDYPPAPAGNVNFEGGIIKDLRWWVEGRAERRWLFVFKYTVDLWMGPREGGVRFENCTFTINDDVAIKVNG